MMENQLLGIIKLTGTPSFCEPCAMAKMKKVPFETRDEPCTTQALELVHADVGGLVTLVSREGYRYWLVIVDDYTHFPWVYFMKHKAEVLEIYHWWKSDVQTYFQKNVGKEN